MTVIGVANPLAKGSYRNLLCVCGSGKKVEKCHGQDLVITKEQYNWIMNVQENREKEFNQALHDAAQKAIKDGEKDETEISS